MLIMFSSCRILSDPDLRARYDSGQSDPSADPDFAEFFAQFSFSQTQPPRSHQTPRKTAKGPTQTIKLDISLEDLFKGREIKLNLSKQKVCGLCKGSGAKPGAQRKECIVCSGMVSPLVDYLAMHLRICRAKREPKYLMDRITSDIITPIAPDAKEQVLPSVHPTFVLLVEVPAHTPPTPRRQFLSAKVISLGNLSCAREKATRRPTATQPVT